MDLIDELCEALAEIQPEHDTPVGRIHPYWARKPMNVVRTVIRCLSKEGDVVVDPFMGSGTTVFSALAEGRRTVGSDLSPLSVFLVSSLLTLGAEQEGVLEDVESLVDRVGIRIRPLFSYDGSGRLIERERFNVIGSYEQGRFSLERTEIVTKELHGRSWRARRAVDVPEEWAPASVPTELLKRPVDFAALDLLPNSRIAIPEGATLADFYTPRNRAAINLMLREIEQCQEHTAEVARLLLSSSLPLLRLSDRKASSQWPFWRPKRELTSRNPLAVFHSRLRLLRSAHSWFDQLPMPREDLRSNGAARLLRCAAQDVVSATKLHNKVDLVVTDPPYTDQAPYLEYSAAWAKILGLGPIDAHFGKEIVKSDGKGRSADSEEYSQRLGNGLASCCQLVRPGGFLVWFYQDTDLSNWRIIDEVARQEACSPAKVIPLPKQRRSLKTVTSPGRTMDGDLLVVFRKMGASVVDSPSSDSLSVTTEYPDYPSLIAAGFEEGMFAHLATEDPNVEAWIE